MIWGGAPRRPTAWWRQTVLSDWAAVVFFGRDEAGPRYEPSSATTGCKLCRSAGSSLVAGIQKASRWRLSGWAVSVSGVPTARTATIPSCFSPTATPNTSFALREDTRVPNPPSSMHVFSWSMSRVVVYQSSRVCPFCRRFPHRGGGKTCRRAGTAAGLLDVTSARMCSRPMPSCRACRRPPICRPERWRRKLIHFSGAAVDGRRRDIHQSSGLSWFDPACDRATRFRLFRGGRCAVQPHKKTDSGGFEHTLTKSGPACWCRRED